MISIKQGDTRPLDAVLKANRNPVNLTGATVVFNMRPVPGGQGALVLRGACSVVAAAEGKVRYVWQPQDVATPGVHRAEWEATWSDGTVETFPNKGWIDLEIVDDLG